MVCDNLKTKQLAKKVRARQEFLNQIVNRIIDLVTEHGRNTRTDRGNSHTRVISELRNFGNFTFQTDLGQTDFGGNSVKAWHHPGKNFREGGLDSAYDGEWTPVLDVYFQEKGNYQVSTFKESADWQKALLYILKNKIKIIAQIVKQVKREREKELKKLKKQEKVETDKAKLLEDAENLGIKP